MIKHLLLALILANSLGKPMATNYNEAIGIVSVDHCSYVADHCDDDYSDVEF